MMKWMYVLVIAQRYVASTSIRNGPVYNEIKKLEEILFSVCRALL